MSERTYRHAAWVRILLGLTATLSIVILLAGCQSGGVLVRLALWGFAVLSAASLAEVLITRIDLRAEGLLIVTLSGRRFVDRREIESVTREKGCPVSIRLRSGAWVRLPDLGQDTRDVADSIREVLKV